MGGVKKCGCLLAWLLAACAARASAPTAPAPRPAAAIERARPPDRDGDGIPDEQDACPDQPETINLCNDGDGCPDGFVVVPRTPKLAIVDQIFFAGGRARLDSPADAVNLAVLDQLAATIASHPELGVVEVHGHAARDEARALSLPGRRAAYVVAYLVRHGVPAQRLLARADSASAACETSDACRAHDRRVDFVIPRQPPQPNPPPLPPGWCYQVLL